jgi:hypothetical protein
MSLMFDRVIHFLVGYESHQLHRARRNAARTRRSR